MDELLVITAMHEEEDENSLHVVVSSGTGGHDSGISSCFFVGHGNILAVKEIIPGGIHLLRGCPKVLRFIRIHYPVHVVYSCVVADPTGEVTLFKLNHLTSILCQG